MNPPPDRPASCVCGCSARRTLPRTATVLFAVLMWFAGGSAGRAQETNLHITLMELRSTEVVVEFRDTGGAETTYHLEHAESLTPSTSWVRLNDAVISPIRAGEYRGTVARPAGATGFLRVVGVLSGGGEVISAAFQPGTLVTREGGGTGPRLVFAKPYTGVLRYVYTGPGVSDSGELVLTGVTEAFIPPPNVVDDETLEGLRYVSLRLEHVQGGAVRVDSVSPVVTEDNDEVWRGMLGAEGSVAFSLTILRSATGSKAWLRSDSTSFFPPGEYVAEPFEFTARRFLVRVSGIAVTETAPPFEGTVSNDLELAAEAPEGVVGWPGDTLSGRYTWHTHVAGRPFLNVAETGEFFLKRQPPAAPSAKVPLTTAQP